MKPICRHCGRNKVVRPRGLCWGCYYRPGVRDCYPSTSIYAHRGVGHVGGSKLPGTAGHAVPGSAERLKTLAERAARNESLWHPDDNRRPSEVQR
jgi:hypothetical protein